MIGPGEKSKKKQTVFLSAGDDSGDLYAARLMTRLASQMPQLSFKGFGLERMREAGLEDAGADGSFTKAMWLHNILSVNFFRKRLSRVKEIFFGESPPSLVILIDYGGFNLFIAKEAKQAGLPVLYYVLPQAWAHGRYRLKKIKKWVSKAAVVYPFEPDICCRYGIDANYVGHPLFDELALNPPDMKKVDALQMDGTGRIVAIFPGSRKQEVRANLPVILDACSMLKKTYGDIKFKAACTPGLRQEARAVISSYDLDVKMPDIRAVELARAAELCITKSGTVTLEIASQHTPMVILYRVNALLYFIVSGMTHTPYAGIVNALAGDMICPEKVMWRSGAEWVFQRASEFLEDEGYRAASRARLRSLTNDIGATGATAKTAAMAMEMMH